MTTYTYKYNDVKATATYDGRNFVVLKGSTVVGDDALTHAFLTRHENQGRRKLREKLIEEGKLIKHGSHYIFATDVAFHSPSQAATIVAGSSKNGHLEFDLPSNSELIEKSSSDQVAVDLLEQQVSADLEALLEEESATEGGKKARLIAYFERNPALRTAAIAIHGTTCKVCGFNFEAAYGEHGKNYIEVHHVIPISTLPEPSSINPREDLTVLCSNCHRMIHRKREAPLSIEELRNVLSSSGASDA